MKVAVVFSGQGSQYTNMGLDFLSKETINHANKLLGYDVLEILKNENNELNMTLYTQPMMVLTEIAIYEAYLKNYPIDGILGFSLGEYSALYAAGVYDFDQILKIISKRALFMQEAAIANPGKMAAVMNMDVTKLEEICGKINKDETLVCANYNSRSQIVISGTSKAIEMALPILKENGAKRVIELNVSGAFHSPLMKKAGEKLEAYLNTMSEKPSLKPVYLNTTADVLKDEELVMRLKEQIQSPVYFYQSIEKMIKDGYTHFVEIGPGKVLSQLIKKNYPELMVRNIDRKEDFDQLEGWI